MTGHANKIDTGAKPLEESKNIFVMGAGNTIGNSQNNTTASKIRDSYVIGTGNTINNPNRTLEGSAGNPTFGDDPSDPSTTKSKIGRGYFILGNNVTATLDDSVYLGTNSAYISDADRSAGTQYKKPTDAYEALLFDKYTGHWATGVVTVGSVSSPRRIQGVAAGLVGPNSMDAINGSQLYAHTRPVGFVADNTEGLAGKDLDKLVVDEQGITNMVKRSAGQAIKLEGGADKTKLSDNNIGTLVKGTNQVDIKLAKELKGLTSAEFVEGTAPNKNTTTINGKGVTINANGPSMTTDGIHAGNLKVTGVASSIADQVVNNNPNPTFIDKLNQANNTNPNNAVNVSDLHNVLSGANGGFGLKDKAGNEFKQDLGTTAQITGDKNINTKVVDVLDAQGQPTGKKALEVGLNPEVELGKKGNDGVDGKLTVNGKDGSAVVINGKDGSIGLNGKDGANGLTIKSAKGEKGLDGNDGQDGKTRIVYEKPNGSKEEVATLNDGLVFTGNNNTVLNKHKLNTTVNVVGDSSTAELANFASATGNLNVVADGNNKLTVQMNKNLKNLNSVTMVNSTDATKSVTLNVTDKGELNVGGDKADGNQVTGVKSSIADKLTANDKFADKLNQAAKDNPNNAVNVGDLHNVVSGTNGGGFGLSDDANQTVKQDLGKTIQVKGKDGITTTADGTNKTLTLGLAGKVVVNPKDGEDGSIVVKGKDGKDGTTITKDAIVFNGVDGVKGKNGADGKDGQASIKVVKGAAGLDGNDGKDGVSKTRIVYEKPDGNTEEVATLNDGLVFTGNNSTVLNKHKLNTTVNVVGDSSTAELANFASATGNLNVVADGNNKLTVQMNKNLKNLNSVTLVNKADPNQSVSLTADNKGNLDVGGKKITNVAKGTDDTDAVNVSQLKEVAATAEKGWNLTTGGDTKKQYNVAPGGTVDISGDSNVTVTHKDGNVKVGLNKNLDLTQDGSVKIGDTKVDNSGVTVGDKVKVDKNGLTAGDVKVTTDGIHAGDKKITGVADGKVSETSKDAINGSQLHFATKAAKTEVKAGDNVTVESKIESDGHTTYTVNATDTTASTEAGSDAISVIAEEPKKVGKTTVTNYKVDLSQKTKDDIKKGVDAKDIVDNKGLTFVGDSGKTAEQKLGSEVGVKGDKNIETVAKGNDVTVKLKEDVAVKTVTATEKVTVGNNTVIDKSGITIGQGNNQVSLTEKGLNNGGNRITNVAPGVRPTDAVNVSQLRSVEGKINRADKHLRAGIAGANAAAGLPQAYLPGKSMVAVSAGTYRGEGAVALGMSRISDNGKVVVKITGNSDTRGNLGASLGAGYQW